VRQTFVDDVGETPSSTPQTAEMTVDAKAGWQSTGVDLSVGDVVAIRASGTWWGYYWSPRSVGPDGWDGPAQLRDASSAHNMALIGRIGSGYPFSVGNGRTVRAQRAGQLLLRPNDVYLESNNGSIACEISLYRNSDLAEQTRDYRDARSPCDVTDLPRPSKDSVSLAVIDLRVDEGLSAGVGRALADLCRGVVQDSGQYILLDRESIVDILGEEDFVATVECDDTRCLVDYGKKLRAQKMVHGRVSKVGESMVLTLKMLDVGSAAVDAFKTATVSGDIDRLLDVVEPKACELIRDSLIPHR